MLTKNWLKKEQVLGYYKFNFRILIIKWIINAIALFVVVKTIKGLEIVNTGMDGFITLVITAAVIGIINTFLKPVLLLITLPLSIFTFGIFTVILNGFLFALAGFIVPGFKVTSFFGAIIGSLLFSLISFLCNVFLVSNKNYTKVKYRIIE